MDVDLDESHGLTCRLRGAFNGEALQFYKAYCGGLRWLKAAEQLLHRDGTYCRLAMILTRYFDIERKGSRPAGVSKVVDPLVARNRSNPGSERFGGRVRVSIGVDGEKCLLLRIFDCRLWKPSRIITPQPSVQFAKQLLIGLVFAALRGDHETAPFLRASSPNRESQCSPRWAALTKIRG